MWLLYGANGYTGRRIAAEAVRRGERPLLAGRRAEVLAPIAAELGCPWRAFALDDAAEVAAALAGVELVLHCAGPFSATAAPMLRGCLDARAHYLDITGEIDCIEHAASAGAEAEQAGVAVIPAVGFDVVPSDCLAAMLAARLPAAERLELAFSGVGGMSGGTARTVVAGLAARGRVRRGGRLTTVPLAWKTKTIPFADGPRLAATVPWGDVASAWYTTGIAEIEVYMAMTPAQVAVTRALDRGRWLVGWAPRSWLERGLRRAMGGGSPEGGRASFWGCVFKGSQSATLALETPGGYDLTVTSALAAVERVRAGVAAGFHTPAQAFGAEFVLGLPGVAVA